MDFIDMIVDSSDEYLTGYYYKRRPKSAEDGRIRFMYKQHNPNSRMFDTVLGNIRADKATYAISTNDDCGFGVGAYIITQNGLIWEIVEVVKNEQAQGCNDGLRWFKKAVDSEINIRMIEVTDLFDQAQAYDSMCEVRVDCNEPIASFSVKESLMKVSIVPNEVAESNKKSYVFESTKNVAVTVSIEFESGKTKTLQIPSYKTLENKLIIECNV